MELILRSDKRLHILRKEVKIKMEKHDVIKLQNKALPLVKELVETTDAYKAHELIQNGGWICVGIMPTKSDINFIMGRVD